jgi:hypothetical protein
LLPPGASDDASQVAVMLEAARAIISDPSRHLAAPLLFLLDGGEEALSPAGGLLMLLLLLLLLLPLLLLWWCYSEFSINRFGSAQGCSRSAVSHRPQRCQVPAARHRAP